MTFWVLYAVTTVLAFWAGFGSGSSLAMHRLRPERLQQEMVGTVSGVLVEMQTEHAKALTQLVQIVRQPPEPKPVPVMPLLPEDLDEQRPCRAVPLAPRGRVAR